MTSYFLDLGRNTEPSRNTTTVVVRKENVDDVVQQDRVFFLSSLLTVLCLSASRRVFPHPRQIRMIHNFRFLTRRYFISAKSCVGTYTADVRSVP